MLLHSMDLPSDIPLQELDATGQTWTTGNPVDTKKIKDTNVFCTLISFIVPYIGVPKGI